MGAINFNTIILNMRAPDDNGQNAFVYMVSFNHCCTIITLSLSLPVLAGAVTMTIKDKHFNTTFFDPAGGGDPILYQHLF